MAATDEKTKLKSCVSFSLVVVWKVVTLLAGFRYTVSRVRGLSLSMTSKTSLSKKARQKIEGNFSGVGPGIVAVPGQEP